jgi:hypothetical protein
MAIVLLIKMRLKLPINNPPFFVSAVVTYDEIHTLKLHFELSINMEAYAPTSGAGELVRIQSFRPVFTYNKDQLSRTSPNKATKALVCVFLYLFEL